MTPRVRPLIIGQAPARGNEGLAPFAGKSGARLARLAGVGSTGDVLPQYFHLHNLITTWPGKHGRGDKFPMGEARQNALALKEELASHPPRQILLMGRKIRRACGLPVDVPYLKWIAGWPSADPRYPHAMLIFPHPSGLNHWWNAPAHVEAASKVMREVIHGWQVSRSS